MSPPEREAAARSCTSSFLSDSMLTTSCCTASPCCLVSRKQCLNQKYWANTKPAARAAQGSMWDDVLRVSITCTIITHAVSSLSTVWEWHVHKGDKAIRHRDSLMVSACRLTVEKTRVTRVDNVEQANRKSTEMSSTVWCLVITGICLRQVVNTVAAML